MFSDLRPGDNDVRAALGDRRQNLHRQAAGGCPGKKWQDSRVIQLSREQRGQHEVRAPKSDKPDLQALFFEEPSFTRDDVKEKSTSYPDQTNRD